MNNSMRNKIAIILKDSGLIRIRKSAFIGRDFVEKKGNDGIDIFPYIGDTESIAFNSDKIKT